MARTVGAIERDMDNALIETNRGVAGSVEKLERLRQELADLTPAAVKKVVEEPEEAPVEDAPKAAPKPKAKRSGK